MYLFVTNLDFKEGVGVGGIQDIKVRRDECSVVTVVNPKFFIS